MRDLVVSPYAEETGALLNEFLFGLGIKEPWFLIKSSVILETFTLSGELLDSLSFFPL